MNSNLGHKIKQRSKKNDIFITPIQLAKKHINLIEYKDDEIWFDPFKNSGNYYNNYPNDNKEWCEILDNKDFINVTMTAEKWLPLTECPPENLAEFLRMKKLNIDYYAIGR